MFLQVISLYYSHIRVAQLIRGPLNLLVQECQDMLLCFFGVLQFPWGMVKDQEIVDQEPSQLKKLMEY